MAVVLFCNATKLACFLFAFLMKDHKPLLTTGDAMASFLAEPDAATQHCGPLDCCDVRLLKYKDESATISVLKARNLDHNRRWSPKRTIFAQSSSRSRWLLTLGLSAALILTGVSLLVIGTAGDGRSGFSWGLGSISTRNTITTTWASDLTHAVLFANLPQLLISAVYVSTISMAIRYIKSRINVNRSFTMVF